MKKAVIYARFSSHGQTEQSIEGQLRICYQYAAKHKLCIIKEYIDRAKTATTDNRPQFQKMLQDSFNKQFDYVLVYSVDRFARDDEDYGADKKILRLNGIKLLSATQETSVNPDGTENINGILTEGILVALAKYYSRELSQKVRRGQFESLEKGTFLGGYMLYGYKAVAVEGQTGKRIEINEDEAVVVRKIFDMYATGSTAKEVAAHLNKNQIRNRQGRPFCPNSIMNMLKNAKYTGLLNYGQYTKENYYPRIIDAETFVAVSNRIDINKRSPARMKAYENYRLSGKLYCGYCKGLMTGESGTSKQGTIYHYYKCFTKKKHKDKCNKLSVRKDALEDLVVSLVLNNILAEDKILDTIENVVEVYNSSLTESAELNILRQDLSTTEKHIANILEAIKNGIFTESTKTELVKLEKRKEELNKQITVEEANKEEKLSREQVLFFFKSFVKSELSDEVTKTIIIDRLVNKVILYDDRIIIILNNSDNNIDEPIENLEELCSNLPQLSPPLSHNPNTVFTKNYIVLVYDFNKKEGF